MRIDRVKVMRSAMTGQCRQAGEQTNFLKRVERKCGLLVVGMLGKVETLVDGCDDRDFEDIYRTTERTVLSD